MTTLRVVRITAKVLLGLVVGVLAVFTLALLALRLPPVKAEALERTNEALADLFKGRLYIEHLGEVTLDGVRGVELRVEDPQERTVLHARGVRVDLFWLGLVWQAVVTKPPVLSVEIDEVSIDHVEVRLIDDGTGTPTLAQAFEPAKPSEPSEPGTGTRVIIPEIQLRHVWVHGVLDALTIDGELERAQANLAVEVEQIEAGLEIARLRARALPYDVNPDGKLSARVRIPAGEDPLPFVRAEFDGLLARADTKARFELYGERLDSAIEVKAIGPETFEKLAPQIRPRGTLDLSVEAKGTLAALRFTVAASGAPGRIDVEGNAQLTPSTQITAKVRTSELDLSRLLSDTPQSALNVEAQLEARIAPEGTVDGAYRVSSRKSAIAGESLPPIAAAGTLRLGQDGALSGSGNAQIEEPGATTQLTYSLEGVGQSNDSVNITGQIRVDNPKRLAAIARVRGEVSLNARIRPSLSNLDGSLSARLNTLRGPEFAARRLDLTAAFSGSFSDPRLEAQLTADGVTASGRSVERVSISAQGTQKSFEVRAEAIGKKPDRLRVRSFVTLEPELAFLRTEAALEDGKKLRVTLNVDSVRISDRAIRVEGAELAGVGSARVSLVWTNELSSLALETSDLQPLELLEALGIAVPLEGAKISIAARYRNQRRGPSGSVSGVIEALSMEEMKDGVVQLDFAISENTLSGAMDATIAGARVRATADEVRVLGPPYDLGALDRVTGTLTVMGDVNLHRLEPLLARFLPIGSAAGNVNFDLQASRRDEKTAGPTLAARFNTSKLRLAGRRETEQQITTAEEAREAKPWSIEEIDVTGELKLDAARGFAEFEAKLKDENGDLLAARASAKPEPTRSIRSLLERDLSQVPFQIHVTTPPRELSELPEVARTSALRGVVALSLAVDGTLRAPRLRADADLTCLATPEMKQVIDLNLSAEYERDKGRLAANAFVAQKPIGELKANWTGDPLTLTEAQNASAPSPVRGDVALRLTRFPLELVPALANQQVRGPISGTLELEGFGEDARLAVKLETGGVLVGTVGVQKFNASVETKKDRLIGALEIGGNRGLARAEITAPLEWGSRVVPTIGDRLEAHLVAKNFRLETLAPLVAGQLSELSGRLDADVRARLVGDKPEVHGFAEVRNGVVHVPALGQRLQDIESRLTIDKGNVELERLTARGVTGRLHVDGGAQLDGVSLRSAEAHLRIESGERIPITIEGSAIGDAWGRVDVALQVSKDGRDTRINVDVPEFTLEMPATNPAALQDLGQPEDIRIGTRLPDGDFVTLPVQALEAEEAGDPSAKPTQTLVEITLGRSVWLRRAQQVEVQLGGRLQVRQAVDTQVTGKIELEAGTLDVQGKRFDIERGVVTFAGKEPSNPTIMATARWDSPEGYSVYAEYTGTAEEGTLSLRAEPPLTDNEILSLLMFGTPDGTFGSGEGGTAQAAIGLAGGTAAQGLNRAISSITNIDVSARIDTSTGTARPELVIQLTPRVTARVTRAVGEPSSGQSPDRTFLTIDFRLFRAWALSTMVGDRGASALDLIWRKRY